jgi:hypothetical protein
VLGVVGQRFVAGVVLAHQPEDIVPVEHAPDSREGIAQAEVDAAEPAAGPHPRPLSRKGRGELWHDAAGEIGIDQPLQGLEGTAELLAIPRLAHLPSGALQVVGLDARHLVDRHFDAFPVVAPLGPGLVEEATPAIGGGQADHAPVGNGQHRGDGPVQVVGDADRLVDHQDAYVRVAANRLLAARQADDLKFWRCSS